MFGRRWCRYAHFSQRWGVLAKVISLCSLQPKAGCSGEGDIVVLTSAKGGVFGRRWCRRAHSRKKVGCFGEGGVVAFNPVGCLGEAD